MLAIIHPTLTSLLLEELPQSELFLRLPLAPFALGSRFLAGVVCYHLLSNTQTYYHLVNTYSVALRNFKDEIYNFAGCYFYS
jgi:hypothetical protein